METSDTDKELSYGLPRQHSTLPALKEQTPLENPGSKGALLQLYRWRMSWLVPDANCCVSTKSPGTGLTSKLVRFRRSVLEHRADLLNDRAVRSGTSCTDTTSSRNSSGSVRRQGSERLP